MNIRPRAIWATLEFWTPFRKHKRKSSQTDLSSVSDRDRFLRCYTLAGEAAMLIPSSPCTVHHLDVPWDLWEDIKHEHFQNSADENVFLVTDVYATSTWAQEHRASPVVQDKYVVNVQNVRGQDEIPENFNIRTTSTTIQQSPQQYPPIQYTILESHLSAARKELYSKRSHWKSLLQ